MPVPSGLHAQAVRVSSLVYLHGFASSPLSSKARFFAGHAGRAGLSFACPDLNQPDFRSLTVTRMLDQVDHVVAAQPPGAVALVGSSLGAFVALHAAARPGPTASRVDRLVFLAPAMDLVPSLEQECGPERLREWEATDRFEIFHYASGAPRELGWAFMADARRFDAYAVHVPMPTLVFQGRRDEVVSPVSVERWASGRPPVELRLLDDGHQLLEHLDELWAGAARLFEVDG